MLEDMRPPQGKNGHSKFKGNKELFPLLKDFGLNDAESARVIFLLADLHDEDSRAEELSFPAARPSKRHPTPRTKLGLYVAEEQAILRHAYESFFPSHSGIELVGSSDDTSGESLVAAVIDLDPKVLLLGVKIFQPATVEKLETVRERCPDLGIVLLSAAYDLKGMKALRELSRESSAGSAYLLKHTIDTAEQLTQVIYSVAQGRIILDPTVMEGMTATAETQSSLLKELSPRELEVLGWVAKGYRNDTIAQVLCLDVRTVERHINSVYNKLENSVGSNHSRVSAALMFLRASGLLPKAPLTDS